ncbi:MAG TPA: trypsin-like peptidase domain-containing protein [Candidatus Polarisedimenticolia bacterium]|nr:trypsin-like peptidase domain-containing protein [Candidatus Polarisedimenticolia bacterium]
MNRTQIACALLLLAALLPAPAAGAPPARRPATPKPPAAAAPAPAAKTAEVPIPQEDGFERSVVRIINYSQRGDWFSPWDVTGVRASSGTGFVIDGGVLLTNAHVVSDARLLLLYLHGDPTPHKARAVMLGHDCDLALVRPEEEDLLAAVPVLPLGGLPPLRSAVETYGYPAGGDQISSTRGVVSRIETQVYAHSGVDRHVAIQTDAAINPGNSGGPMIQNGKVVGVAFQGTDMLENTGFGIPVEVIRHFLDDAKDGTYDGYPDLAILESNLENPAARRRAGMTQGETGVRVDFVNSGGSAEGQLQTGDVLLAVDGIPIANDGSVLMEGLRFDYGLMVDRHQIGETLKLRILRDDERRDLAFPLVAHPGTSRYANQYDVLPRYYIYAGLVFEPLNVEMLETTGRDWVVSADKRLVQEQIFRPLSDPKALLREPVVLLRRLDDPVNINIAWYRNQLVTKANGKEIDSLGGLIEAIEANKAAFHVLELGEPGRFIVLDRKGSDEASPKILERYGVLKDRNP